MAIKIAPELEPPPTRTAPERRRSDGWFTHLQRRVKLALAGDDEDLLVANSTAIPWHIYHTFHRLGLLSPGESALFHLSKHGNLNARPGLASDAAEYLVLDLTAKIQYVEIYQWSVGKDCDVYDMRAV